MDPSFAPAAELLEELQAARPPLEELTIEGYEIAPTDGLATLQLMRLGEHFGQLRALALENCSLSADALCAALAVLVRDGSRAPLRLNVSRNQLGPLGGLKLATLLRGATTLAGLDASANALGAAE